LDFEGYEDTMKFGLYLPNFGDYFDARFTAKLAIEAENAGWDGFFIWDHLTHPHYKEFAFADPWILLTAVAVSTTKIRLGALVTPIARRRPWKLAKETVTLDHLSEGRLIFGAGLGTHDVEFSHFGEESDPKRRGCLLDEGLTVLDGLWRGDEFEFKGEYFSVSKSRLLPSTLQKPRIPVWIAGVWPNKRPLIRSSNWDGYFPMKKTREERFLLPDEIAQAQRTLRERRPASIPFDIIASGYTDKDSISANIRFVSECGDAGATWWLEALDPWRFSGKDALNRILQGPPRK
jgi:alkanesulfonate monooxygenase SsuD/methylene tetrahydromethanopterin reductase-like flavin-dependent oxidoreductase (luciferase family)